MTDDTTLSGTPGDPTRSDAGTDTSKDTGTEKGGVVAALGNGLLFVGLLVFLAVGALLGWLIAIWLGFGMWAHFLGNRIDGEVLNGTLWGLSLGFVCSVIPLIVARQALRRRPSFVARLVIVLVALAIALPNIATLAIRFGSSRPSHISERVLSTEAPGFYVGSYIGIGVGIAVFLLLTLWGLLRWNDKRKTRKLSRKLAEMAGDTADGS